MDLFQIGFLSLVNIKIERNPIHAYNVSSFIWKSRETMILNGKWIQA